MLFQMARYLRTGPGWLVRLGHLPPCIIHRASLAFLFRLRRAVFRDKNSDFARDMVEARALSHPRPLLVPDPK